MTEKSTGSKARRYKSLLSNAGVEDDAATGHGEIRHVKSNGAICLLAIEWRYDAVRVVRGW